VAGSRPPRSRPQLEGGAFRRYLRPSFVGRAHVHEYVPRARLAGTWSRRKSPPSRYRGRPLISLGVRRVFGAHKGRAGGDVSGGEIGPAESLPRTLIVRCSCRMRAHVTQFWAIFAAFREAFRSVTSKTTLACRLHYLSARETMQRDPLREASRPPRTLVDSIFHVGVGQHAWSDGWPQTKPKGTTPCLSARSSMQDSRSSNS
jgi:hypothetical protein